MPSEVTVFSDDGEWKAEVEAWKNNLLFYSSIGTQVTVYHREETSNIWGSRTTDWVERAADSMTIRNTYSGSGPGTGTRTGVCTERSSCELKEWAVGATIDLPADSVTDVGGGAILDLDRVVGDVTVRVGHRTMSAQVEASSALADSSFW